VEVALVELMAGMDTDCRTRLTLDGRSETSSAIVSSSWSEESGTKVRVRFCEWRVSDDLFEGNATNVNRGG
jgi:hypothetical protein